MLHKYNEFQLGQRFMKASDEKVPFWVPPPQSKGKLIVNCLPFELCDIRVFALQLFVGRFEEVVVVEPGEGFLYQFAEWRVEEQSVEGVQGHRTRRYCRLSLVAHQVHTQVQFIRKLLV